VKNVKAASALQARAGSPLCGVLGTIGPRSVKRQWARDDFMGGVSNPSVMRRITNGLVLAVFAGNCLIAWAMQKSMLEIRNAHRVLPCFASLCIDLRPSFVLLPLVAALCYLWLWFRKGENAPGWRGFVIVTMTVLILFVLPAIGSSYLLLRSLVPGLVNVQAA